MSSLDPQLPRDARRRFSFDVFDTAITRLWMHPTDLFLAAGRELRREGLFAGDASEWRDARCRAENRARILADDEEVTHREIYEVLRETLGWTQGEATRALAIELLQERRSSRPIAETIERVEAFSRDGKCCLFISDTYFDAGFVAELIRGAGLKARVPVYASAEHRLTKRTGRLFERVLSSSALLPWQLEHTGDNRLSDVDQPRRRGISARLYRPQAPTRYEEALYEGTGEQLLRSAIAGCARAVRLQRHFDDPHLKLVWDTAANVAGPALAAYVVWVLRRAQERGLRRLYFLARDGQILVRIAQPLAAWLGIDIECRYLHASRQSLFLPAVTTIDDVARGWFGDNLARKTLRQVLARVDIAAESVAAALEMSGFPRGCWDTVLRPQDRAAVIALLDQPLIRARVLDNAARRRADLLDYLRQQGFADGTPAGIVDIGWKGRLQLCLSRALAGEADFSAALPLTGFYYGLERRPGPEAGKLITYAPIGPAMNGPLLEIFCAADHGSVRAFERDADGQVQSVLVEPRNEIALQWGLTEQQEAMALYAQELARCLDPRDVDAAALEACLTAGAGAAFALLARRPSYQEATAFGRFGHADDQTHSDTAELAPAFGQADLLRWLTGLGPASTAKSFWAEASIVRGMGAGSTTRLGLQMWDVRNSATQWLKRTRS